MLGWYFGWAAPIDHGICSARCANRKIWLIAAFAQRIIAERPTLSVQASNYLAKRMSQIPSFGVLVLGRFHT
jgi:hypothetical protein